VNRSFGLTGLVPLLRFAGAIRVDRPAAEAGTAFMCALARGFNGVERDSRN